jgi:hypothetical protein
MAAARTVAPPIIARVPGSSPNASHTQTGARISSSTVIKPASAAGMRRAPAVKNPEHS